MNLIVRTVKALLGLFFDDGSLALALIGLLLALAVIARAGLNGSPLMTMLVLVGGTFLLLLENVLRTARRAGR